MSEIYPGVLLANCGTSFCGLYCMTCADKTRFRSFWRLAGAAPEQLACTGNCRDNSCGPPGCEIRKCAQAKTLDQCMECEAYPCKKFQTAHKEISVPQAADNG